MNSYKPSQLKVEMAKEFTHQCQLTGTGFLKSQAKKDSKAFLVLPEGRRGTRPVSSGAGAGGDSTHTYFPFLASPEEVGGNDSISSVHTPSVTHMAS